jgi:hypothetical protein
MQRLLDLLGRCLAVAFFGPLLPNIGRGDVSILSESPNRVNIDLVRRVQRVVTGVVDADVLSGDARLAEIVPPAALEIFGLRVRDPVLARKLR